MQQKRAIIQDKFFMNCIESFMAGCLNLSSQLMNIVLFVSFLIDSIDDHGQIDIMYFSKLHKSTTYRFDGKLHLYDRSDPSSVSHQLILEVTKHSSDFIGHLSCWGYIGFTPSVRLSAPLSRIPCLLCNAYSSGWIFSCDQAAIWLVLSVCPSVRPSVCLSVRHTFFTMFPSSYHHEIFRSYYQWQKWRPCKRSRSKRSTPNLTISGL